MGECFLYGQGGAGGNVKMATGEFVAVSATEANDYTQTVQLSTEFIPDYIAIMCVGKGTSTGYSMGYLFTLFFNRSEDSWNIVWGRGTSSDSKVGHYDSLESWDSSIQLTYNEDSGELIFKGASGGYTANYVAFTGGAEFRWIMWKEQTMKDIIKKNFILGYWSRSMVRKAVQKKLIDKDDYYQITGEAYR